MKVGFCLTQYNTLTSLVLRRFYFILYTEAILEYKNIYIYIIIYILFMQKKTFYFKFSKDKS